MCKKSYQQPNKNKVRKQRGTADEKLCKAIEEIIKKISIDDQEYTEDDITDGFAGQHFHMDFGFIRGSGYSNK